MKNYITLIILLITVLISCKEHEEVSTEKNVYGIVTDSKTNEPLKGVSVTIFQENSINFSDVTTDDGAYKFDGLIGTNFKLEFSKPTYTKLPYEFSFGDKDTRKVSVQMEQDDIIIRGIVSSNYDGSPVGGATIKLKKSGNIIQSATSQNNGMFEINNVNGTEFAIIANATGYDEFDESIKIEKSGVFDYNITLHSISSNLKGKVISKKSGLAIENCLIEVSNAYDNEFLKSAYSNESGDYSINNLDFASNYEVRFLKQGYNSVIETIKIDKGETKTLNVTLDTISYSISGSVKDSYGISNALIEVFANKVKVASTTSDSRGNYSLEGIEYKNVKIIASKYGYSFEEKDINFPISEKLNFHLSTAHLYGNATDDNGSLSNVYVKVFESDGTSFINGTYTNHNGYYYFLTLKNTYRVDIQAIKTGFSTTVIDDFYLDYGFGVSEEVNIFMESSSGEE